MANMKDKICKIIENIQQEDGWGITDIGEFNAIKELDELFTVYVKDLALENQRQDDLLKKLACDNHEAEFKIVELKEENKHYKDALDEPFGDAEAQLVIKMQKEVIESKRKLTKEIDIILNGNNAAEQASLCDLITQIKDLAAENQRYKEALEIRNWTQEEQEGLLAAFTEAQLHHGLYESLFATAAFILKLRAKQVTA